MFGKKEDKTLNSTETLIGPSVLIKGDFNSKGNVVIEGSLEGSIVSKGHVRIGEGAKITADIEADSADVAGRVKGDLEVNGNLVIRAGATITGNVQCMSISIEEGGTLNGKCHMTTTKEKDVKKEEKKEGSEKKEGA